jgi:hypothetical protein
VIYHILNTNHHGTIIAELTAILKEARDYEARTEMFYGDALRDIPRMGLRLNVPKIPGQDTTQFSKWPHRLQFRRKCLHIECDEGDADLIKHLMDVAKRRDMFQPYWGRNARLSEQANKKTTKMYVLKNMEKYVKRHVNYHSSMTSAGLIGVVALDDSVPFYKTSDPTEIAGYMTLRHVLYNHIKLADGHSLFGEVHQEFGLAGVDVVIPNIPEAESMAEMMNKQLAAFLITILWSKAWIKSL